MAVSHAVNGPRLVQTDFNGETVQTAVTLRFNNLLDTGNTPQVDVQPTKKFTASVQGETIRIIFTEPLDYGTQYKLTLQNIKDTRGKSQDTKTAITTKDAKFYYLQRDPEGLDTIYTKSLRGDPVAFAQRERIVDFTVAVKKSLALILESSSTKKEKYLEINGETILLPETEPIQITGRDDSPLIIIKAMNSTNYETSLYTYNIATKTLTEVMDINDKPIGAYFVELAQDGQTLVYVRIDDNSLYIDKPDDGADPLSLGVVNQALRYMPDNSGIFVQKSPDQYGFIDAQNGYTATSAVTNADAISSIRSMGQSPFYLLSSSVYDGISYYEHLELLRGDTKSTIYKINTAENLIASVSLSLNDQFTVIEQADQPVIYDNLRMNSKPKNIYTKILDLNGKEITRFDGFGLQWATNSQL
jgi:hypothetical protein